MCGTANFPLIPFEADPSSFICSSGMKRGSELLNPIHPFHITNDFAALCCILHEFSLSQTETHWLMKQFFTQKLVYDLIPFPAFLS